MAAPDTQVLVASLVSIVIMCYLAFLLYILLLPFCLLCLFYLPGRTTILPFGHCKSVLNQPASVKVVLLTMTLPLRGETMWTDKYNLII